MKIALDTNILAYAEGVKTVEQRDAARDLIDKLPQEDILLPVQVLGELFSVLTQKAGRPRTVARDALLAWSDTFDVVSTTPGGMLLAAELVTHHAMKIWDAIILATASDAQCRLLLSEDFQEGFTWGGVTVTNPFATTRHPLFDGILDSGDR